MRYKYPYFWQKNSVISLLLIPFSWIFSLISKIRNNNAIAKRIGKYVICVGNATVGGTGKTQLIKWLAKYLHDRNLSYVIITKAYGSNLKDAVLVNKSNSAMEVGDESLELLTSGTVIAAKNILYAKKIIQQFTPDIVLVDDGLQNPYFIKDLSFLTIDSSRAIGNGRLIPAGPLREKFEQSLAKTSIIINVGKDFLKSYRLMQKITDSGKPFYKANIVAISPMPNLERKYVAFCGIGNPNKFFGLLDSLKFDIVEQISYPDHHNYTKSDLEYLNNLAKKYDAKLVTTRKDFVKLAYDKNIEIVDVTLDFGDYDSKMRQLLDEKIPNKKIQC